MSPEMLEMAARISYLYPDDMLPAVIIMKNDNATAVTTNAEAARMREAMKRDTFTFSCWPER